jgi:RAD51-like protein 3
VFTGEILELVGQVATGKTQLCHSAALEVAKFRSSPDGAIGSSGFTVCYFDSAASFTPQRIAEMHEAHRLPDEPKMAIADIMTRIRCIRVFNAFSLINGLQQLRDLLEKTGCDEDPFASKLKLVVIDSLGSLISPILGSKQTMGHGIMIEISRIMKAIAREHHIAFLVTNYAVARVRVPSFAV